MCGIAGIVGKSKEYPVSRSAVSLMCDKIVHRGPDDEGLYVQGHVGLGMRRLSIIDLSTGHQPIHNEDKNIWIVFNGEIYNFPELRPELESRGHKFYTNTDTEVIVHLYEEFGSDCVQKLRGMFAFAIWDARQQRLLLARDRFGKKPLHYAISDGRLYYGSEIKSLLAVAPELSDVDSQGLLSYFSFGYVADPLTAFTKIKKLPPGHLLEFSGDEIKVRKYWDLPRFGTNEKISEEECLEELERRLGEAVRIRLISDVPLGALLSGGVDSSTVVALMAKYSDAPVKTFTIKFGSEDFDESVHARMVAEQFKTDHHEFEVKPNFMEMLDELTQVLEEPFADSSIVPTYYVSQLARQHVTVALAGDGGDELFAGYDRYQINLQRRKMDFIPGWAGQIYRKHIFHRLPESTYGRRLLYTMSLPAEQRYLDEISTFSLNGQAESIFSDDFRSYAKKYRSPIAVFREYLDSAPADDALSQLQYLDVKTYLPADILTKVDRMSMANSLEVRAPILDHVFAEWVTQLPTNFKMRAGNKKYILKKLAERLGVPRNVIYRPKQGFAVPLVHWFRRELKQELLSILLEPRTLQRGYFDAAAVRRLVDEHLRGRRDRSGELWILLIFELWYRNVLEARPYNPGTTGARSMTTSTCV
ncbi:MAG TPA: asparagine synthase (glutamine-hydrolyzing) [Candidatus Sulfotelmatobacter sp.]|nr:asparagine synthase (glutamine-hydrolyzing) [Candidatus Sulfotelmatobacter sp.]